MQTPSSAQPLPRWQCHKQVWADKITAIGETGWNLAHGGWINSDRVALLTKRNAPVIGDYWVRYEDDYESWSPAKAFEDGYTLLEE